MFVLYLCVILLMSVITYILYVSDKSKAKRGVNRISEKCLLLSSFFFGALGGIVAMYTARHKTKHWYFVFVNIVSLALHVVILYFIIDKVGITGFDNFLGKIGGILWI